MAGAASLVGDRAQAIERVGVTMTRAGLVRLAIA